MFKVTIRDLKERRTYQVFAVAFTEQGLAMLSSVLNSKRAIKVNIQIIRLFTEIRKVLADTTELRLEMEEIKKKLNKHSNNIEVVFGYPDKLIEKKETKKPVRKIGFRQGR